MWPAEAQLKGLLPTGEGEVKDGVPCKGESGPVSGVGYQPSHTLLPPSIHTTHTEYVQPLPRLPMGPLPFDQLFAKGRLDLWVAQAWMEGEPPEMVQKIVQLSVASGRI